MASKWQLYKGNSKPEYCLCDICQAQEPQPPSLVPFRVLPDMKSLHSEVSDVSESNELNAKEEFGLNIGKIMCVTNNT